MLTPTRAFEHEIEIRKSRFIACIEPVESRRAAMVALAAIRERWPAATHYCWALLAGADSGAHDDGEPGGTAGRPILNVLQHKQLGNVLAVVVRYFGGVKLGAGGLVRAYSQAVSEALAHAELVEYVVRVQQRFSCEHAQESRVRRACEAQGARIDAVDYTERPLLTVSLAQAALPALRERLDDLTQGRITWLEEMTEHQ